MDRRRRLRDDGFDRREAKRRVMEELAELNRRKVRDGSQ